MADDEFVGIVGIVDTSIGCNMDSADRTSYLNCSSACSYCNSGLDLHDVVSRNDFAVCVERDSIPWNFVDPCFLPTDV